MSMSVPRFCDPITHLNEEVLVHIFSFLTGPRITRLKEGQPTSVREVTTTNDDDAGTERTKGERQQDNDCAEGKQAGHERIEEASAAPVSKDGDGEEEGGVTGQQEQEDEETEIPPVPGPFWCVNKAGRLYLGLALVSHGWKEFLDGSIDQIFNGTIPLNIDWDEVTEEVAAKCVAWLCHHKLSIGRIRWICNSREPRVQHFYTSHLMRLLQDCDTIQLACLDITIHLHFVSPTFVKRASSKSYCERQMIRQRTVQNLIAQQCPNLVGLGLKFIAVGDEDSHRLRDIISPALFSLPSVRYMAIILALYRINSSVHGMFFNNLIQNLPNLNVLHLGCASQFSLQDTVFHVDSNSLLDLNVERFDEGVSINLNCPRLKRLSLRARFKGPRFLDRWEICFHQVVSQVESVSCGCVVKIADASHPDDHHNDANESTTGIFKIPDVHMMLDYIVGEQSVQVNGIRYQRVD